MGARILEEFFTWIDAEYKIHAKMRGQTGGAISMGYGFSYGNDSKHKINMKSSTEAELEGVRKYLPYNIWLLIFIDDQGYGIKHNVILQDNQSTTMIHINGRNSCTGNSSHINVRYFC